MAHGIVVDMTGREVGRLTALWPAGRRSHQVAWACACSCGATAIVVGDKLRNGNTKSCGCLRREMSRIPRRGPVTHGHTIARGMSRTYRSWDAMIGRCTRPSAARWKDYGGRGIKVCDRWHKSFAAFLADMGDRPDGMSIDRIDVNGNYEMSNCRWATRSEQQRNRRPRGEF